MRILFVGLGNMGLPMATRINAAGHELLCFDIDSGARNRARELTLNVTEEISNASEQCEALILMLPNSNVVHNVLIDQSILSSMKKDSIIIDMGSSRPNATKILAEAAQVTGVKYLDAPVSGGVIGAVKGELTIMVGGLTEDFDFCRELLEIMGVKITHVGPVGAGHALKALNNLLSATHLLISSEALLVGHELGLDYQIMLDVFNGSSGRSGSTEVKWPNYILPETFNSGFGMALMAKDMMIALDLAESLEMPHGLATEAVRLWNQAVAESPINSDHTSIVKWLTSKKTESR